MIKEPIGLLIMGANNHMKKINVAILSDGIGKFTAGSFVTTYRIASFLKKGGHKVIFLGAKYPDTKKIDYYKGIKTYRFSGIKVPKTGGDLYLGFSTKKEMEKILLDEKIDILHVMVPTPLGISAVNAAKELGIKVIAHSHTQPENIILNLPKFIVSVLMLEKIFYKFLIWFYKKAYLVICPSKLAERLLKEYYPDMKTVIISNGVDLSKFKKEKVSKKFLEKYGLNGKKIILYVGRLSPEKNIPVLIKAMPSVLKKDKDIILAIVGKGDMSDSLKKLSNELNLRNNVKFLGKVSDKEIIMSYNSCEIFVLPSLFELEGMVILESMACGKPILVADSKDSASTQFVNGNGYLFNPDGKDLPKEITSLINNKKLLKEMGKISLSISKKYDVNKCIKEIEKVYFDSLKNKN